MVDDAMRGARIVGMIQPAGDGMRPRLAGAGCAGRIVSYAETDDGRLLITLRGIARFRIAQELAATTPYRQVRPDFAPFAADFEERDPQDVEARFDRPRYLKTLKQYLKVISVEIDWSWVERAPAEVLINSFAMLAPIEPQEKQALLEAPALEDRAAGVLAIMDLAIAASGSGFAGPGGSSVN
jgi:Lon protease-like protein